MSKVKSTRLRYTYEDDLALLKEFLSINPTINPGGWETIQQHISIITGKNFLIRTLKQHIMLLIEIWLKKEQVDQIRSGVEEPQCERNALLQEVHSLCRENNYIFKQKKSLSKDQQICNLGKKIREEYATTSYNTADEISEIDSVPNLGTSSNEHDYDHTEIVPSEFEMKENFALKENHPSNLRQPTTLASLTPASASSTEEPNKENSRILGPNRKRINRREPLKKNVLAYLTDKHENATQIRLTELELEKRKVAVAERTVEIEERKLILEEKRLDLEYKERMARIEIENAKNEIEVEQRKVTNQLLASQLQLIDNLLEKKN